MTMRVQRLQNGMWQVVETDTDGTTMVYEQFAKKWHALDYIACWDRWEEEFESMDSDEGWGTE